MVDRVSAQIIAFPRTAPDRLQRALASLDAALEEQRLAIAAWRASISDLHGAMHDLSSTVRDYDSSLSALSRKVGSIGDESRKLEAWADGVLSRTAH